MALLRATVVLSAAALTFLAGACKEQNPTPPVGMVADAAAPAADAGPMDITKCAACALSPSQDWSFQGVYRDAQCTDPLVQTVSPACGVVPALGQTSVNYALEVGGRKTGESANVNLTEQIAPEAPRFMKAGTKCVASNEAAVHVTPGSCSGQRVCRNETGALACTGCQALANGCPQFEETRMYAETDDAVAKGKPAGGGGGGGGNLGRLRQCCAALGAQAAALGSSPEAGVVKSVAAQCMALVAAAGPSGNAPELGALRAAMQGRPVPAICAGF